MAIAELIQGAFEAEQVARKEGRLQLEQDVENARSAIQSALGDMWAEMKDRVVEEDYTHSGGRLRVFWYLIDMPDLGPFAVVYTTAYPAAYASPNGVYLTTPYHKSDATTRYHTPVDDPDRVATFMLERYRERQQKKQEERDKAIKAQLALLGVNWLKAKTPQEADEALARLGELAPDDGEKWLGHRQAWQDNYEVEQQREAEKAAYIAQLERLADAYRAELKAYWADVERIDALNIEAVADLQSALDVLYDVWELTYAAVAYESEYGEPYLDKTTVTVLAGEPDEEGFWPVYDRGLKRRKVYNQVSLEGPHRVQPTDCVASDSMVALDVKRHVKLYYHPEKDRDAIKRQLEAVLTPYPQEPGPPEELGRITVEEIQTEVMR